MRTQFGLQKIEKGLVAVQMKLMELINKNYVLKSRESVSLHRDVTLRNIEINKLVDRLIESIRLLVRDTVVIENQSRSPLKPMVDQRPVAPSKDLWTYSHEESTLNLARARLESRKNKELYDQGQDRYYRNKSASVTKRRPDDDDHADAVNDLRSEFSSKIQVLSENMRIAVKRGQGLASEYKKIDENLQKLVKFLAGKQRSSLLQRYSAMFERSEHYLLVDRCKELVTLETDSKQTVMGLLQECYERIRKNVNNMKNQTKERRDMLIMMVRNDKLSVENVHTSPKKA